jgi:hypothetical protein
MANRTDDLLLVLSQKEASMLRDIIGPEEDDGALIGKTRIIQAVIAGLLLAGIISFGLLHPELVRALVESVMLLIR